MDVLEFNPVTRELNMIRREVPTPSGDQVLVKVYYSGVCGTDIHIYEGHFPCKSTNFIPGHEFSGVVHRTGPTVSHVKVGDNVAVNPSCACHVCELCCSGRYNICKDAGIHSNIGIFQDGGWAEFCLVPAPQVYRLSDAIPLQLAALSEPISCIVHGMRRVGDIAVGEKILIQGSGIIGILWAALLHHKGHRKVTVSEPSPTRREIFRKLGTGFACVDPMHLEGFTAEVIVDCSGNEEAIEKALPLLSPGGRLCLFGVASPEATVRMSPFMIYEKEITISGVMINKFAFPEALGLIEAIGPMFLAYDKLGVRVYNLTDYREAFDELKKGTISKAVFRINRN